ncbi:hypothetical protein CLU83_0349 [Flavobacterium sp. 1]|uniref:hypothetical protein n=1 Tax=Flavobacterium sp. 1 TaxID=2035200 RepID=UPI000C243743|nr:hypothetical protein [Flavobacterium sp. 1]PJJ07195.1 hypothetical protein CLU83_0349 [Flavobacterium sp. 1]
MKKIQVGFLLSYDYLKLKKSIPPVYKGADEIFIAIDKEYRTWSGQNFEVDETFFEWIKEIDVDNKIRLYRDDFYISELSAIENDTRERHLLSLKMGIGNWLIQVDADEIFIDFEKFIKELRKRDNYLKNPEKTPIQIAGFLVHLYKYTENGILYVNAPHKFMLATNYPNYKCARQTKQRVIYTNTILLHETLCRTEDELRFKIENWGHNVEVNSTFLEKWISVNEDNYKEYENFYYIEPERWKKLGFLKFKEDKELLQMVESNKDLNISRSYLFFKNFGQWINSFFK